jgi:chaperonin GroES
MGSEIGALLAHIECQALATALVRSRQGDATTNRTVSRGDYLVPVIEESRSIDVTLEPLDEFVVIQPVSDETETRAGLILPASAAEAAPCRTGIVTAVGADVGGVEAGDKVLFPRDAGYDVRLGGIDVKVLRREELIARIHD